VAWCRCVDLRGNQMNCWFGTGTASAICACVCSSALWSPWSRSSSGPPSSQEPKPLAWWSRSGPKPFASHDAQAETLAVPSARDRSLSLAGCSGPKPFAGAVPHGAETPGGAVVPRAEALGGCRVARAEAFAVQRARGRSPSRVRTTRDRSPLSDRPMSSRSSSSP
jgi:hypothetical protein